MGSARPRTCPRVRYGGGVIASAALCRVSQRVVTGVRTHRPRRPRSALNARHAAVSRPSMSDLSRVWPTRCFSPALARAVAMLTPWCRAHPCFSFTTVRRRWLPTSGGYVRPCAAGCPRPACLVSKRPENVFCRSRSRACAARAADFTIEGEARRRDLEFLGIGGVRMSGPRVDACRVGHVSPSAPRDRQARLITSRRITPKKSFSIWCWRLPAVSSAAARRPVAWSGRPQRPVDRRRGSGSGGKAASAG